MIRIEACISVCSHRVLVFLTIFSLLVLTLGTAFAQAEVVEPGARSESEKVVAEEELRAPTLPMEDSQESASADEKNKKEIEPVTLPAPDLVAPQEESQAPGGVVLGDEVQEGADTAPDTDTIAADFNTRCSGCHTIGGGDMKGPDLAAATLWTEDDLVMSIRKMQKHVGPIKSTVIKEFAILLRDVKVKERIQAERDRSVASMAASYDAPDEAIGRKLFFGTSTLKNGGMACSYCHAVGKFGGNLGPDLTTLKERLPRVGMLSAFQGANFPVMRPAYKEHPVTKQEAIHLAGFFEELDVEMSADKEGGLIIPIGVFASLLFLFLIGIIFKNRGPAGIRARLVNNAQREV